MELSPIASKVAAQLGSGIPLGKLQRWLGRQCNAVLDELRTKGIARLSVEVAHAPSGAWVPRTTLVHF